MILDLTAFWHIVGLTKSIEILSTDAERQIATLRTYFNGDAGPICEVRQIKVEKKLKN